jgi:hypothetical protein
MKANTLNGALPESRKGGSGKGGRLKPEN